MSIIEEVLENKEEIILKIFELIQGKEAKTKLKLNDIKLNIGDSALRVNGELEVSFVPFAKKR